MGDRGRRSGPQQERRDRLRLPSRPMSGKHKPRQPQSHEGEDPIKLDPPRRYINNGTKGNKWPTGPLKDNAPAEALLAQGIAKRTLKAIETYEKKKRKKVPKREIAAEAGIGHQTLYNFLNGHTWPDIVTIARLEMLFDQQLFGIEHRPRYQNRFRNLKGGDTMDDPSCNE